MTGETTDVANLAVSMPAYRSQMRVDSSVNLFERFGDKYIKYTPVISDDEVKYIPNEIEEPKTETNGLENFGIEEDTPDLFDNNSPLESSEQVEEEISEEDEFEIPAFLRRQKN